MNVARLELCKELLELSGWDGTELRWYTNYDDASIAWVSFVDGANGVLACPAYDLGYLVWKFAGKGGIEIRYGDKGCIASSQMQSVKADTPEDAVATLAIVLFQQGAFQKDE